MDKIRLINLHWMLNPRVTLSTVIEMLQIKNSKSTFAHLVWFWLKFG